MTVVINPADDEEYLQFLDAQPLDFGKHRGLTPEQIAKDNPSYITWMFENIKPKRCSHQLYLIAEELNSKKPKTYGRNYSQPWLEDGKGREFRGFDEYDEYDI